VMYRLNRSAAEIYYGRARDAAPREGLITDALETLEHDLREAATQAASERSQKGNSATTEDLLAQVAELRRAMRSAQREASQSQPGAENGNSRQGDAQGDREAGDENAQGQRGDQNGNEPGEGNNPGREPGGDKPGNAREGREPGNGNSQGDGEPQLAQSGDQNGSQSQSGARDGNARAQSRRAGGAGAQESLSAWDPITPTRGFTNLDDGRGSLARQTAAISQRIRDITNRMTGGELTPAELDALRRTANQLRRLNGNPMADQGEAMLRLVDQIELTALQAAARAKGDTPAHATLPAPDSPRYREAVAEYYRRLGNR
jgi:hypothetical protein